MIPLGVILPDLRIGGLQSQAVRLATSLGRDEFSPHFYTFDGAGPLLDELRAAHIPHTNVARPGGIALGYAAELAEHLRDDGMEVVHCHNVTALFHGARAARLAGRLPVLFTEHDREMPAPWRHRLLHRWAVRKATRIVAVSANLERDLVRYEGFPRARTSTLFNGVPDPAEEFPDDRPRARAELGWDDRPVVVAVGALTPVKNHAGLLRAMMRVWAALPAARLVVAGVGELDQELQRLAATTTCASVDFLGERRDVARLLAGADVFVLPSHREGLSLSLIEAHGAGRPSVVYDVGGNGEVVQDGLTGWLVPAEDEGALGDRILAALNDPEACRHAGTAARRRFTSTFTHDRMVGAYVDLYRELGRTVAAVTRGSSVRPGGAR